MISRLKNTWPARFNYGRCWKRKWHLCFGCAIAPKTISPCPGKHGIGPLGRADIKGYRTFHGELFPWLAAPAKRHIPGQIIEIDVIEIPYQCCTTSKTGLLRFGRHRDTSGQMVSGRCTTITTDAILEGVSILPVIPMLNMP